MCKAVGEGRRERREVVPVRRRMVRVRVVVVVGVLEFLEMVWEAMVKGLRRSLLRG